jgi:hypothetical protein
MHQFTSLRAESSTKIKGDPPKNQISKLCTHIEGSIPADEEQQPSKGWSSRNLVGEIARSTTESSWWIAKLLSEDKHCWTAVLMSNLLACLALSFRAWPLFVPFSCADHGDIQRLPGPG